MKIFTWIAGILSLTLVGLLGYYILFLNHIAVQEVGIAYNSFTGEITVQRHPGWYVTSPITQVATLGTLPTQVCVSAGTRITSCKLVRFVPSDEGVKAFIAQQGFHYYAGSGGVNGNCNVPQATCTGIPAILKGYAFSGEPQPFLEVVREENAIK